VTCVPPRVHPRTACKVLTLLALTVLLSATPRAVWAQPARPPCAACVALLIDAADAEAMLATGVPAAGLEIAIGSERPASPGLGEALVRAGARVWLVAPPGMSAGHETVTGVFLSIPDLPPDNAERTVFAIRRAATDLRAARPDLRVGLVLTPALVSDVVASGVAPYLDAVWLGPELVAQAGVIASRYAGLARWIERGAVDVLTAGAGLADEAAVVDARGRAASLATQLAALRPLMPPGLTPLPEVRVVCNGCRADVWLHPETLDAIAVVHGTAPGSAATVAPDALRIARADLENGTVSPIPVTRTAEGVRVEINGRFDPLVLRIAGWRGADEDVYTTGVRVSAQKTLTVDEIIARHQAQRARQARIVKNTIAAGTTVLTFDVPGFAGPVEITARTRIFTREALTEVAQDQVRVNGVDMDIGARAPRLPIIEPERVATPPLTIALSSAYRYELAGRAREGGRDCYVVKLRPRDPDVPSFTGRAWIDATAYALVRLEAAQTALAGPIVSSQQHDVFAPVRAGSSEVWLPVRSSSFQIYQAAALRTPIHREIVTPHHEVNVPDFDARLSDAHASDAVMLRETPQGYRYLVPAPPETKAAQPRVTRVVAPDAASRVWTAVFGALFDPNIDVPLPFAGLSFLDLNAFGGGGQVSAFYGGSFGQAAVTVPAFLRRRWQLTSRAFGIAASYNDRSFRDGIEQYDENILQRPFRADATVIAPLSSRAQLRLGYEFEFTAFDRNDDTAPGFVVPADAVVHGLRVGVDLQRGPWSLLAWWNPARRAGWRAWGRPGLEYEPAGADFQRYGATAARSWVIAPGAVARFEGSWLDGHDLDRFSRYTFDSFESRLHGYPSASLRFDRGAVVRSVATWTTPGRLRLDGFADLAAVRDPGFGAGVKSYPGVGLGLEIPLARRMLVAVEYGYGVKARDTDGSEGTHVVKLTGFKIF
jgi:hypothetical protein